MITDAKAGRFSVLLIHKVNRFGRNKNEIAYYKYLLNKNGVEVISVAEQFGDGPHSVILESLMEGMAEFYALDLATETMKGLMVNADHCRYNGGRVLYGYNITSDKKYSLHPQEAPVVERIFRAVANGTSYGEIISSLAKDGITRRGSPWKPTSIHELLRNERYTGTYIFNQRARKEGNVRNHRKKKPANEVVKVPGGIPAIVDRELFDRVQALMDGRRNSPPDGKRAKRVYLLSGLIECGMCGSPYVGDNRTARGKEYPRYLCSGRKRKNNCHNPEVSKHTIEKQVMSFIRDQIAEINPKEFAAAYNKYSAEYATQSTEEIIALRKQESSTQTRLSNIVLAIEAGGDIPELSTRMKELSAELSHIRSKLHKINTTLEQERVSAKEIEAILQDFAPVGDDLDIQRKLKRLIKGIVVTNNQAEIVSRLVVDRRGVGEAFCYLSTIIKEWRKAC